MKLTRFVVVSFCTSHPVSHPKIRKIKLLFIGMEKTERRDVRVQFLLIKLESLYGGHIGLEYLREVWTVVWVKSHQHTAGI